MTNFDALKQKALNKADQWDASDEIQGEDEISGLIRELVAALDEALEGGE